MGYDVVGYDTQIRSKWMSHLFMSNFRLRWISVKKNSFMSESQERYEY